MTAQVTAPPSSVAEPPAVPPSAPRRGIMVDAAVALGVWLPVSLVFVVMTMRDLRPLENRAIMLPLLGLLSVAAVVVFVWYRWRWRWLAAAAVGYLAAWVVLMLRTALQGTQVSFGGHVGDNGRLAALATRYSQSPVPADSIVPGITGEYPPLLPWLAGRTAAGLGLQGWQLLGDFQILFASLTVLAAFLMWRLVTPPWTAMAVCVLTTFLAFSPHKAFSVISLVILVPLVLAVTASRERRLPWPVAGVILGLILLTYWGWLVMAFFGILACVVAAWRREENRLQYVAYLAKIAGVALVAASWFVVPLVHGMLTAWGPSTGDTYGVPGQHAGLFPFLEPTVWGVLQLIGLLALVWLRGSEEAWWAAPLLWLTLGAYAFRLLGMADFLVTNHTLLFYYTERVYSVTLLSAGVLAIAHAAPLAAQRFTAARPAATVALALAVAVVWAGNATTVVWMPSTNPASYARAAYAEPLPDGGYTTNGLRLPAGERRTAIPARQVEEEVERVRGAAARPMTLSAQESFFVYVPWPGYLGDDRGASANGSRWDERFAELERLAGTADPHEFARASASTRFGGVDVFLLIREGDRWLWRGHVAASIPDMVVTFTPAQFDAQYWEVVELPGGFVAAIRR